MGKRIQYTKITPLPTGIPRQLALDMLHSHGEVISLNPLVTGHKPISAPRDAASDEFFAQWYEISEIITWGFGMKKKIAFKGVFHDLPNGLQTHTYAPMGVDLRNKWTVRGNQPGEPREPRELGVETPTEGLYLREDVEIVCNMALTGFVKKEMKAAAGIMVDRMTRKAELLDEGVLHAMFEDGKLKTTNPNLLRGEDALAAQARENFGRSPAPSSPGTYSPPASDSDFSTDTKFGKYSDLPGRRQSSRTSYLPAYQQQGYQGPESPKKGYGASHAPGYGVGNKNSYSPPAAVAEVEGSFYYPQQQQGSQRQYSSPNVPTFQAELADTSIPAQDANDRPAPLNPHRNSQQSQHPVPSPRPSPGLQQRHSSSHSSPQIPQRSAHRTSSAGYQGYNSASGPSSPDPRATPPNTGNYTIANPDNDPYNRHRSADSTAANGLASRIQGLGITETTESAPTASGATDPAQFGAKGSVSKCPVCGNFEGDEAAVSHHVAKHFA